MSNFFHVWRRKIGVVTLVMACLFATGWVRSVSIYDVIAVPRSSRYLCLFASMNGKLSCTDINGILVQHFEPDRISWWADSAVIDDFDEYPIDVDVVWGWNGFGLAKWRPGTLSATTTELTIPYWSIVIPLTLLSTYLLLRKSNPAPAL